ncbi:MAG TPA: universal stress protein [Candidatus Limnocylindria bacterium]|nr:universal stress protein [Candidatus Limnocylindria bacterium]
MEILFATDGTRGADAALDVLCDLPLSHHDRVSVISAAVQQDIRIGERAVGLTEIGPAEERAASAVASAAAARLGSLGIAARPIAADGPASYAVERAALEIPADLIVIGSRGRGVVTGMLLGSVARELARHAPAPTLVVRGGGHGFERVLFVTDSSPLSRSLTTLLTRFPLRRAARLWLQPVESPQSSAADLEATRSALPLAGVLPALRLDDRLPRAILERAVSVDADLIVLGTRGHEVHPSPFPTPVDIVLATASCSVLVGSAPARVRAKAPALVSLA